MYVNAFRIQAGRATQLNDNDEICFGRNVLNNELKYNFFLRDGKASLERSTESFTGTRLTRLSPPGHASTASPVRKCVGSSGVSESAPPGARTPRRAMLMQQSSARKRLKLNPGGEASSYSSMNLSTPVTASLSPTCLSSRFSSQLRSSPTHPPMSSSYLSCQSPMKSSPTGLPVISSPSASQSPLNFGNLHYSAHVNASLSIPFSSPVRYSQPTQVLTPPRHCNLKPQVQPTSPSSAPIATSTDRDTNDSFDDLASKLDGRLLDGTSTVKTLPPSTPAVPSCSSTDQEVEDLFDEIVASSQDRVFDGTSAVEIPPTVSTPAVPTCSSTDQEVEDLFDEIVASSRDRVLDGASAVETPPTVSTPAVPTHGSTDQEVEDLFDEIAANSRDRRLDGASAVETTPQVPCADTVLSTDEADSSLSKTSPAVTMLPADEAIQDQTQREKHQLLSSIEALKSELAAKNELISKQERKPSTDDAGGVVTSMREEFTCVICQELFISAHTLPCSHSFCEYCIKEWIKTKKECPICRKHTTLGPIHTLALDNAIARVESKLTTEERKEREDLKEKRMAKLCNDSTPSTSDVPSNDPLNDSLDYGSPDGLNSDEEPYDLDPEEPYDLDPEDYGDLDVDYYGGVFVYNGGYGGFGRCYHCGKCCCAAQQ